MKKFSELGVKIESDRTIFECKQISITDILNCEIVINDYLKDIKTKHGENRYLVHIIYEGAEAKFFSNSTHIKNTLDAIPKSEYPFTTIIKTFVCGMNKYYKLT
jgi:hypothetical protein